MKYALLNGPIACYIYQDEDLYNYKPDKKSDKLLIYNTFK